MTRVFTLPDLGEGLEEAELVRWLVDVGDVVAVDAPVAEVETAKAMVEVPSPYGGRIAELHGSAGDVIMVGSPLISVEPVEGPGTGSAPAGDGAGNGVGTGTPSGGDGGSGGRSGNVLIGYGTSEEVRTGGGRRALRRAQPAKPATADDEAPVRPAGPVSVASPIVRAMARQAGLDLHAIRGSGPDGLVVRADVERAITESEGRAPGTSTASGAAEAAPASAHAASGGTASGDVTAGDTDPRTGLPVGRRVPLTGVRRTVATRLSRSRQEIPEATTWVDVDATRLVALRAALARPDRPAPGVLALVARFVVAGLARYPELNSWVDTEGGQIVHLDGVNLGIAAQTDRGLVVPVVRDAHARRTRDLDTEIRRLTTAAREGRATAAELSGGSFTLNNYGVLGVDGSAAIINHPEVAILGMGRILPRPWVVDGEVVVRSITQLSLVFDHRVCDGGTAGGFLRFVADSIEQPESALLDAGDL